MADDNDCFIVKIQRDSNLLRVWIAYNLKNLTLKSQYIGRFPKDSIEAWLENYREITKEEYLLRRI